MPSEVRKNGRMVSPEEVASRPIKALKSITVTAVPCRARKEGPVYCLAQSSQRRTSIRYGAGIRHARIRARTRRSFLVTFTHHEIESGSGTTLSSVKNLQ